MITARNLLMSGMKGPTTLAIATSTFYTPEHRADAAIETLYRLTIEGLDGAPTSALLTVAFQICQRSSNGVTGGIAAYTDAVPVWSTIDANRHGGFLPDGDWPTRIANQASTFPLMFTRRIRGGCSNRLAITPSYGGGTTPAFRITLESETRY